MRHLKIDPERFEEKLEVLKLQFSGTELDLGSSLYVGTNSSVLSGILSGEGLLPLGGLRSQGRVPYSGELTGWGNKHKPTFSINHYAVSTTTGADFDFALGYTKDHFNLLGWSQVRSVEILDFLNKASTDSIPQTGMNRQIEYLRNISWQTLAPWHKDLIENSFPMLVEITPAVSRKQQEFHLIPIANPNGSTIYEIAIIGGIFSHEIRGLFVPKSQISKVKNLLLERGRQGITILAIETLWSKLG